MRRLRVLSLLMSVLIVVALFGVSSLAQAASPASIELSRLRSTPTPRRATATPTPRPPTPTPTPLPQPTCWSLVAGPSVPGYDTVLSDIAGSGDNDIWAVGAYTDNSVAHTLALHWNGSAWSIVPSPDLVTTGSNINNVLNAVAVVAPNDVWAVGYAVSTSVAYQTITLHWNGSAWTVVPSPNVTTPGFYNSLNDVVAVAANDIWAVGGVPIDFSNVTGRSLLMHWDGTAWTLVPEPPDTINWSTTTRTAVAARSSGDVWAVGKFGAWHWDGSAWGLPTGALPQNLTDIDANGGSLWSVGTNPGYYAEGYYSPSTANAQWFDGTTWQTRYPVNSGKGDGLNSVRVISANSVWAVGFSGTLVLAEKWNGSQWAVVTAANGNPSGRNVLQSVNTVSPTGLWAVGYYLDSAGNQRALIERYTCQ